MAINNDADEAAILARLGERVEKAVAVIGELRRERDSLKTRLAEAEAKLKEQEDASERLSTLEEDYDRFRKERSDIRNRIESILSNLESLDVAESE
jgi:FtsZ-binding cell division protein ZapB